MAPALELLEKPVEYLPVKAASAISTRVSATVSANDIKLENTEKHQRVMNVFRAFIADLCQQYGEGHAG
jgi:dihydroxyacetone synthase